MRNFKQILTKFQLAALIFFMFGVTGFSSCSHSLESVCSKEIPQFLEDLRLAYVKVEKFGPRPGGRAVASETAETHFIRELTADERTEWKIWAEKNLALAKNLMFFAEDLDFPAAEIMKIHHLSNELVVFWGHIERGKTHYLAKTLHGIQNQGQAVQMSLCSRFPMRQAYR